MGLESNNKRRLPAGSCTVWKAELSKTLRIKVVVKKRIEDGDKTVKGLLQKSLHSKVCLCGYDTQICALEIESCLVLCYCTSTAKGCTAYPLKYLFNHIANRKSTFLLLRKHPGLGRLTSIELIHCESRVKLSASNNQVVTTLQPCCRQSPALPLCCSPLTFQAVPVVCGGTLLLHWCSEVTEWVSGWLRWCLFSLLKCHPGKD